MWWFGLLGWGFWWLGVLGCGVGLGGWGGAVGLRLTLLGGGVGVAELRLGVCPPCGCFS